MINRNTQLMGAIAEDRAATAEALQVGLYATRPHSAARLSQLCELGERMMETSLRVVDARRDVGEATIGGRPAIDYVIPV
jgi:hypothetical protein